MIRVPFVEDNNLSAGHKNIRNHSYHSTNERRELNNEYSPLMVEGNLASGHSDKNFKQTRQIDELGRQEDTSDQECSFHTAEQKSQFLSDESATDLVQILKSDDRKLVEKLFSSVVKGDIENLKITLSITSMDIT